jgi:hypothetical protein
LFSGCIENISDRFQKVQVVYVNVTVGSVNNTSVIQYITAKGGEVSKIYAPGAVLPEKFPAIYTDILQIYNISRPQNQKIISLPNGQEFTGDGNYSFTIHLLENSLNKSQPIFIYTEITTNRTRIAAAKIMANWTE